MYLITCKKIHASPKPNLKMKIISLYYLEKLYILKTVSNLFSIVCALNAVSHYSLGLI